MDAGRARQLLEQHRVSVRRMAAAERAALEEGPRDDMFGDLSGADQHQADSGSETFERERDATILRIAGDVEADIELALAKLATGRYGFCETCHGPIPDERLDARPEARFCEAHERMWELGSITMNVPGIPKQVDDAREPGWDELDELPDDGGEIVDRATAPEERALHVEEAGGWLEPEDVEEADAAEAEELADELRRRRDEGELEVLDIDEVERDEEALGR